MVLPLPDLHRNFNPRSHSESDLIKIIIVNLIAENQ